MTKSIRFLLQICYKISYTFVATDTKSAKLDVNSLTEIESKMMPKAFWKIHITAGESHFSNLFIDFKVKYMIITLAIIAKIILKSVY